MIILKIRKWRWCVFIWTAVVDTQIYACDETIQVNVYQLNGHEFELIPGDSKGQGSLECCSPWGLKSRSQRNNWTTTTASVQTHTHTHTHTSIKKLGKSEKEKKKLQYWQKDICFLVPWKTYFSVFFFSLERYFCWSLIFSVNGNTQEWLCVSPLASVKHQRQSFLIKPLKLFNKWLDL